MNITIEAMLTSYLDVFVAEPCHPAAASLPVVDLDTPGTAATPVGLRLANSAWVAKSTHLSTSETINQPALVFACQIALQVAATLQLTHGWAP